MTEDAIISLAIDRSRRSRYRALLANPRKRRCLLDKLNHNPPFDERWTTWFSSFTKAVQSVEVSSSTQVYVLSADAELDGKSMSFGEAVEDVPFRGWGAIIGVSPVLALYCGELGERAAVIRKEV